jgi:cytochrome c
VRGRERVARSSGIGTLARRRLGFFLVVLAVCSLTSWTLVHAQDESEPPEQVMSHGFDCFSCHAIDKEVVGPAWIAIADHYHHDPAKASYLAAKIRGGSVGDFGKVPMPAHQDMKPKVAANLASYILSLKGSLHGAPAKKYTYKNTNGENVTIDFPVFENYNGRQVVNDAIFSGFEKYNSYCFRCHGFDAVGGEYAPDLRKSLQNGMSKHDFFVVSMEGRESKGMPGWAGFFDADELSQVYEYVEARTLDLIAPGRPLSKTD